MKERGSWGRLSGMGRSFVSGVALISFLIGVGHPCEGVVCLPPIVAEHFE
jgi:hypothetical protein